MGRPRSVWRTRGDVTGHDVLGAQQPIPVHLRDNLAAAGRADPGGEDDLATARRDQRNAATHMGTFLDEANRLTRARPQRPPQDPAVAPPTNARVDGGARHVVRDGDARYGG